MKEIIKNAGIVLLLCALLVSIYDVFTHNSISRSLKIKISDLPQIEDKRQLIVVTDYSPVGYFVKGDTVAGFNYDLLQIIQEYTPAHITIVLETSLEVSLDGLASGKYNVIARRLPITTELKDKVLFTEPIIQNKQVLVQRKQEYNHGKAPIRSHLDLAGKTLHVPKKSPAILRINNLSEEIGDVIHYQEDEYYGAEQLTIMVAQGEIDYAVCDEQIAKKVAESQPELDLETNIGFTHFEAWAVSKDAPVLLDSLNAWIIRAKGTKKYNYITKLYYY